MYVIDERIFNAGNKCTVKTNSKMIVEEIPTSFALLALNQVRFYSFVPKTTGTYFIVSNISSGSPSATIYMSGGTTWTTDINGNNSLYSRLQYQLTAGTTYIIGISASAGTASGVMTILPPDSARGTVTEYTYDAYGNRTKLKEIEDGEITETVYTYDKNDRLLSKQTGAESAITYSYDYNGNMTGKSDGTMQTFDVLNRMTSYKSSDGITTTYSYYPDDMRKSKKVGTNTETTQVWIDEDIALDLNGSDVISSYIYGQILICGAYGWYLYNAHGDVTALTDSYGNVSKNYDYDPFGVQRTDVDETDLNPYRYCGEYYDVESGYTYLQARYYDSELGRFISEDPALDGNNWYVYCGNDPVNMIDPTGMWSQKVHQEITKAAYKAVKKIKKYKFKKSSLLNGCVYPDKHLSGQENKENKKWHGHTTWRKVKKSQLNKAANFWKKKKYKKAYFELGKGLHTIQDYYAHNVKLDGEWVASGNVSLGKFYKDENGNLKAGKYPEHVDETFIKNCKKVKVKIGVGTLVHAVTSDNVYAYFNGEKWICSKKKSKRYYNSIDASEKYLRKFIKRINKKKKKK